MSKHKCNTPIPFAQQFKQARRVFKPRDFSAYLGFEESTSNTPLEGANSDFMFCLYHILHHLTLLTECEPIYPKAVLAVHRKVLSTLYNPLYFLHSQQWQ